MKQVYFLIFLFLGLSIKAQYKSICDDSKLWQSEFVYQDVQNMESEWRYHEGFFKGDTTINDTTFHKYFERYDGPDEFLVAYAYEDVVAQRFYIADLESRKLSLQWDFSLEVGDTLFQEEALDGIAGPLRIDSIVTMVDQLGVERRAFYVSSSADIEQEPAFYLEGVGSTGFNGGGPMYGFNYIPLGSTSSYYLDCFRDTKKKAFGECRFNMVGIEEKVKLPGLLEFSPNPISGNKITVELPQDGVLSIVNTEGKTLYRADHQKGALELVATEWPLGIYQVLLATKDGNLYSAKMLKAE